MLVKSNFVKKMLENGLISITENMKYVKSVSIGIWAQTGSHNETEKQAGITHFLEHMLFKGTNKRSAYDIARSMESVGGHLNAFTSSEYTCYYARCLNSQLPKALDILSDMVLHPSFPKDEIEKEKKVVAEEMKMHRDSPSDYLLQCSNKLIFDGHPLGRPITGFEETVANFNRQNLFNYMKTRYQPENLLVAAAGNIEHEKVLQLVRKYFSDLNSQTSDNFNPPIPPYQPKNKELHKDIEQAHLIFGRRGLNFNHDDKFKLLLTDAILTGGMSSRLHQKLREKYGCVYTIDSINQAYKDTGLFGIYAATSKKQVGRVEELIFKELQNLAKKKITEKELKRAKAQLKGRLIISLENTSNRMQWLAKNEIYYERFLPLKELIADIEAVEPEEIQEFASRFFEESLFSKAILMPKNH